MNYEILCVFLVSYFVQSESNVLYEEKLNGLKWSKLINRFPEIQLIHNGYNNLELLYPLNEGNLSYKFDDSTLSTLNNITNEVIALWKNETSDLIEFVKDSVRNASAWWWTSQHKCNQDLLYLIFNIKKMWAIQMLDAAGKPPSGIMLGDTRWLGNSEECQEVVVPMETLGSLSFGGFSGHQCLVQWNLNIKPMPKQQFTTGVCVPSSCSSAYLKNDSDTFRQLISEIPFINATNSILEITDVDCSDHMRSWTGADIAYMCLLAVFCVFIIAGTFCDILDKFQSKKAYKAIEKESTESNNDYNQCDNISINVNEDRCDAQGVAIAVGKEEPYKDDTPLSVQVGKNDSSAESEAGWIKEFLICFSLYTNVAKLINVGNQQGQLSCLHGIRFLSMSWIILGHTFLTALEYSGNPLDAIKLFVDSFSFQAIYQGTYSVDTFFFLSGFLLAYLFLKEYSKADRKINWLYYYLHRIWRLSPAFFMLLGFYTTLWLHLGYGPLWPTVTDNGKCEKFWWWNVLYILNFQDMGDMCMAWTWYLANDMQFYVISPLFLVFLWKLPIVGNLLVGIVMLASWIITGIISANNSFELIAGDTGNNENTEEFLKSGNKIADMFNQIYTKPYCRIGSYLIGILVGYALYKTSNRQKIMKTWISILGWLVSLFLLGIVVFGPYHSNMGKATAAAYNSLSRTAWSIGVGWVVFACLTGYGGPVNTLLSWKFWVPLSRLTYCAYLVHPMVLNWYFSSLQFILNFQMTTIVTYYFGFLLSSYVVASVASLIFESPMMALEKFLLKRFSSS